MQSNNQEYYFGLRKGLNVERRRPSKSVDAAKKILKIVEKAHSKYKTEPTPVLQSKFNPDKEHVPFERTQSVNKNALVLPQ